MKIKLLKTLIFLKWKTSICEIYKIRLLYYCITCYCILFALVSNANNIAITSFSLTGQNTTSHYTFLKFNLSWDNSWRTSTYESNWDAAWVFAKWRKQGQTTWNHSTINTSGHTAPSGSTIDVPTDGKGVFIYKDANGIGSNSWASVQLRWNYGTDGLTDADLIEVCVYAIEMVYIPQGAFYVGDGVSSGLRGQFEAGTTGAAFQITSETTPSTLGGGGAGSLGNNNTTNMDPTGLDDFNDVTSQTLPSAFPKGYAAFYVMKYEVTQEQYAEFLNTLTYTQQKRRTQLAPNSVAGTLAFSSANRNGISIKTAGVSSSTPAIYGCNFDGDSNYNEVEDGSTIANNRMHFADCEAYMDWAGLRPITELEFEKACRGTLPPVAGEFAWGTKTILNAATISNGGQTNEVSSTSGSNCTYNNAAGVPGPMRVGSFAQTNTDRQSSGATYYGVMDMSGNVREMMITLGNSTGRAFTGLHGDGALASNGEADVTDWPTGFQADVSTAVGAGYRAYDWQQSTSSLLRLSDRNASTYPYKWRDAAYGFRGGRTAP